MKKDFFSSPIEFNIDVEIWLSPSGYSISATFERYTPENSSLNTKVVISFPSGIYKIVKRAAIIIAKFMLPSMRADIADLSSCLIVAISGISTTDSAPVRVVGAIRRGIAIPVTRPKVADASLFPCRIL